MAKKKKTPQALPVQPKGQLAIQIQPLAGSRSPDETDKAVQACNDWLRLGSGRSIAQLIQKYSEEVKYKRGYMPPSNSAATLYKWSSQYQWVQRSAIYDADADMRTNRELKKVMDIDLANPHGRIDRLLRLAEFLEAQIYETSYEEYEVEGSNETIEVGDPKYHNIWMKDFKTIGAKDKVEIAEIYRFNAPLIKEFRETLNDIALETGGRVRKAEITHQFTWVHQAIDDLREGRLTPELLIEEFGSLEDAKLAALEDTGGNAQLVEQFMMLASMPLSVEILNEGD